ncbi:MAG: NUDIX domain-containing protein [Candidatus Omnitrophica bacterium]|nr:NUDIX domain-containing protein [Candidatus Omnitrophota bacterium]
MGKKRIYEGKIVNLSVESRTLPTGVDTTLEIIRHPGAVLIIPYAGPGAVLMLRQYRPVVEEYLWEFPAGTLDPGESIRECARRELREETGYSARRFKKCGVIYPAPGYSNETIVLYEARELRMGLPDREEDEIIEVRELTLPRVMSLCSNGKIKDAKTLSALQYLRSG